MTGCSMVEVPSRSSVTLFSHASRSWPFGHCFALELVVQADRPGVDVDVLHCLQMIAYRALAARFPAHGPQPLCREGGCPGLEKVQQAGKFYMTFGYGSTHCAGAPAGVPDGGTTGLPAVCAGAGEAARAGTREAVCRRMGTRVAAESRARVPRAPNQPRRTTWAVSNATAIPPTASGSVGARAQAMRRAPDRTITVAGPTWLRPGRSCPRRLVLQARTPRTRAESRSTHWAAARLPVASVAHQRNRFERARPDTGRPAAGAEAGRRRRRVAATPLP